MRSKLDTLIHLLNRLRNKNSPHDQLDYKRASDFDMPNIAGVSKEFFASRLTANLPYTLISKKNHKVALLIHGLSDSPYYMKDIGQKLFEDGYNIVAITLSGHSTNAESLSAVTVEDWIEDIRFGIDMAQNYGNKLFLIGMSTGGSLAVDAILDEELSKKITGVVLISPALKLIRRAQVLCLKMMKGGFQGWKDYGEGVRYQKMANESICCLCRLNQRILNKMKQKPKLATPIVSFFASDDLTVDVKNSSLILHRLSSNLCEFFMGGDEKIRFNLAPGAVHLYKGQRIEHISALLEEQGFAGPSEVNPNFDIFYKNLSAFLSSLS